MRNTATAINSKQVRIWGSVTYKGFSSNSEKVEGKMLSLNFTTSSHLLLILVEVTCCHGQTLFNEPKRKPPSNANVWFGYLSKVYPNNLENVNKPINKPNPKTTTVWSSGPNGLTIKSFIAGMIIVYIPKSNNTKLPESPGSINAEIPRIPDKNTIAKCSLPEEGLAIVIQ